MRDALRTDPLDPHLESAASVPHILIWGGVFTAGFFAVSLICGGGIAFSLTALPIIGIPYLLTAVFCYLRGLCWLRRLSQAMERGICMTGEILGAEYIGGNRTGFWVSGIRLPDGKEFFSPHYRSSAGIYRKCDVYIYRHRRYLTNFRR